MKHYYKAVLLLPVNCREKELDILFLLGVINVESLLDTIIDIQVYVLLWIGSKGLNMTHDWLVFVILTALVFGPVILMLKETGVSTS